MKSLKSSRGDEGSKDEPSSSSGSASKPSQLHSLQDSDHEEAVDWWNFIYQFISSSWIYSTQLWTYLDGIVLDQLPADNILVGEVINPTWNGHVSPERFGTRAEFLPFILSLEEKGSLSEQATYVSRYTHISSGLRSSSLSRGWSTGVSISRWLVRKENTAPSSNRTHRRQTIA